MILLTLRDLQHRALRFVVVIVLAAVVFALLFVMTGLVEQFQREPRDTVEALGGTAFVLPEGVSGPFTAAATMALDTAQQVTADEQAPVVVARSTIDVGDESAAVVLIGHEPGALGTPVPSDGRGVEAPGEAVVAREAEVDVGEQIRVAGRPVTVVGTTDDTTVLAGIPVVFLHLSDAQELVFRTDQVVSGVLVAGEVADVPPGTVVMGNDEVVADTLEPLDGAISSVDLVRALLWLVAGVIIGAIVYLSALDRLRDFAVLKAIGATNRGLMGGLAIQATLVALCAVALAAVIQLFLAPAFPLKVTVPTRAFVQIPVLAVVVALIAGAAGMRKVASSDPALAFAGAGG